MTKIFINYFIRFIRKSKLNFFLNMIGLSVAMVVFIFITLYVENEVTFDAYHTNADKVFRLTTSLTSPTGQSTDMALANPPFAQILKNECPEIEEIACVNVGGDFTITYKNEEYKNVNIREATPSIFNLFSYPVLLGDPSDFFVAPNTIILTESLSQNIFGKNTPIGEEISVGKAYYRVIGVIEDLPTNTDLQFEALTSSGFNGIGDLVDWGDYFVYIQTINSDVAGLNAKIEKITNEKYSELLNQMGGFNLVHHLQPLKNIHFENTLLADNPKGNKTTVFVFSVIAILILIIAGINYINLTLAQLEKRELEFFIRKAFGAGKRWIFYYIISESVLNVFLAAIISISLAVVLFPAFNQLLYKSFDIVSILKIVIPLLVVFIVFGIITGLYPAFKTTKTSDLKKQGFGLFGKSLVTFQNAVTIIMIAGLLIIWNQVNFMKNADLGFNEDHLIAVSIPSDTVKFPGKEVLHQEFSSLPEISSLSFGGNGTILGETDNWIKAIMADKNEEGIDVQFILNIPQIDENYIELFGIELLEGRNFLVTTPVDADRSVIINESYAKIMGWDHPVGRILDGTPPQEVVGVVKNFHFDALNNPIEPLKFEMIGDQPAFLFMKIEPKSIPDIQGKWKSIYGDEPFEYRFIDQHMAGLYQKNEKEMSLFSYFTIIAILISCMGLYGLSSHFISNRTKEIGIRRVNGASVYEILTMLNWHFVKWITIAFVIATPIAWYAMHNWLNNFAYKTELNFWVFAFAGLLALGIALLTVSWQSWRAATRNPVEALRYE